MGFEPPAVLVLGPVNTGCSPGRSHPLRGKAVEDSLRHLASAEFSMQMNEAVVKLSAPCLSCSPLLHDLVASRGIGVPHQTASEISWPNLGST
jgi:hypothetical protein